MKERAALDRLLFLHPGFDLLGVDWQLANESRVSGSWLLVHLGQRSDDGAEVWAHHFYAVYKVTGDIYGIGFDGAVYDEPFIRGADL